MRDQKEHVHSAVGNLTSIGEGVQKSLNSYGRMLEATTPQMTQLIKIASSLEQLPALRTARQMDRWPLSNHLRQATSLPSLRLYDHWKDQLLVGKTYKAIAGLSMKEPEYMKIGRALTEGYARLGSPVVPITQQYRNWLKHKPVLQDLLSPVMRAHAAAYVNWKAPAELGGVLKSISKLQGQLDKLGWPVINWASAATLAHELGSEGIQAQLAQLGIEEDGTVSVDRAVHDDPGLGVSRRTLELMTILSFLLAILVPIYQQISGDQWQHKTDVALETERQALTFQAKKLETLTKLVEDALKQQYRTAETRYVVLDRVAAIRSFPQSGAVLEGKLLPGEMVKPVSIQGKWIEVEYYDWFHKEYRVGWALKKYFKRLPIQTSSDNTDE